MEGGAHRAAGKPLRAGHRQPEWVPWILLAAFALAAVLALLLLFRMLRNAAHLAEAHEDLAVANTTLERRAEELSRSNEQLERFASIASHDLQEPLRKVQTFAERMELRESENLSDNGRDYLKRMSDAASRMQDLIDDLLAFSRLATQASRTEKVDLGSGGRGRRGRLSTVDRGDRRDGGHRRASDARRSIHCACGSCSRT